MQSDAQPLMCASKLVRILRPLRLGQRHPMDLDGSSTIACGTERQTHVVEHLHLNHPVSNLSYAAKRLAVTRQCLVESVKFSIDRTQLAQRFCFAIRMTSRPFHFSRPFEQRDSQSIMTEPAVCHAYFAQTNCSRVGVTHRTGNV